jgi:hypothetical protein
MGKLQRPDRSTARPDRRRGLAPLEMVLALPILLMITALMVNFAVVACWKVRALGTSRQEVFASRWPRDPSSNPRPDNWLAGADSSVADAGTVPEIDDPRLDQPVVRGQLPTVQVDRDLFDPTRGLRQGRASVTRDFPLIRKMGDFHLESRVTMLDDHWQYSRMGIPSTVHRRLPFIYTMPFEYDAGADSYGLWKLIASHGGYAAARGQFSGYDGCQTIEKDQDFIQFGPLVGRNPQDFHPRLQRFCSLEQQTADDRVQNLVDRIRGRKQRTASGIVIVVDSVALRMTKSFLSLYRSLVNEFSQERYRNDPMRNYLPVWQAYIAQLEAFRPIAEQEIPIREDTP